VIIRIAVSTQHSSTGLSDSKRANNKIGKNATKQSWPVLRQSLNICSRRRVMTVSVSAKMGGGGGENFLIKIGGGYF